MPGTFHGCMKGNTWDTLGVYDKGMSPACEDLKETQSVWSYREGGREQQKARLEMDTGQITKGL